MTALPIACHYAIVRFMPFVETGEFANAGVVMIAPDTGYFGFRLETRRYGRITRFFEEVDGRLYRHAMQAMQGELCRIAEMLERQVKPKVDAADLGLQLYAELTRPRESVVRFSEIRVVLADDPKEKLNELFSYYVERNFVTRDYIEAKLEKKIRRWLTSEKLADRFQRARVGDDEYHVTFPFVEENEDRAVRIIKPLHLGHDQPNRILDHGGQWAFRVQELRRRRYLPEQVLFTVNGPQNDNKRQRHAYDEAVERLKASGVTVEVSTERRRIIEFAQAVV